MMKELQYPGHMSLILTFICASIQLVILFDLIKNTRSKLPNPAITLAYAAIISFVLYPIGIFIQSAYEISINSFDPTICPFRISTQFTFSIGKILMFLFYTVRLYRLFNKTAYKYKKLPLQIFGAFIIVGFSVPSLFFAIAVINGFIKTSKKDIKFIGDCDGKQNNSSFRKTLVFSGIAVNMVTDLTVSIIILRLYLKKLILCSTVFDTFEFKSQSHKKKNEIFMTLILRTTNLLIICVIAEYIILLVPALSLGVYWMSIKLTVNVVCIYFSFGKFNDKLYGKLCCCMDKCCYKCCAVLCFCCCSPKNSTQTGIAIEENSKDVQKTSVSVAKMETIRSRSNHKKLFFCYTQELWNNLYKLHI
eukprot:498993_1